jgi:2-methylcitrate dehydratase PrpD
VSTVIEAIASWCATHSDSEPAARSAAKDAIADTIGCLYAGRTDASTSAVTKALTGHTGEAKRSARWIGPGRTAPALAALANGTAAHALDFDDNFTPGMSHASAVIVPALLAVADWVGADGKRFVDAYLLALQAQDFVGSGVRPSHYTAGWHGTSTVGSIGTALGTAYLLGLDAAGMARALSLGTSMASGVKGQFGSLVKPFHAGMASRNAVEAALLAAEGLTGRLDILERDQGFLELFGGPTPPGYNLDAISGIKANVIVRDGLAPKAHPCCGSTHRIVDSIIDLMNAESIEPDSIASVNCHVGIANYRNLPYTHPTDEMEARFSMQYCAALAFRQGILKLSDFTPEAVRLKAGDPLMARIGMTHYSAAEEAAAGKLTHRLDVKLNDGRSFSRERLFARGTIDEPFREDQKRAKFMDCCDGLADASGLYDQLMDLEKAKDLSFLDPLFA